MEAAQKLSQIQSQSQMLYAMHHAADAHVCNTTCAGTRECLLHDFAVVTCGRVGCV